MRDTVLGYTGAYRDPVAGGYPLGNGYRVYLPGLMRFSAPDAWSPFGRGGVNTYAYCGADPINRSDPGGHAAGWLEELASHVTRQAVEEGTREGAAISVRNARAAAVDVETGTSALASSSRHTADETPAKRPRLDPSHSSASGSGSGPGPGTSASSEAPASSAVASHERAQPSARGIHAASALRHPVQTELERRTRLAVSAIHGHAHELLADAREVSNELNSLEESGSRVNLNRLGRDVVYRAEMADRLNALMGLGDALAERASLVEHGLPVREMEARDLHAIRLVLRRANSIGERLHEILEDWD